MRPAFIGIDPRLPTRFAAISFLLAFSGGCAVNRSYVSALEVRRVAPELERRGRARVVDSSGREICLRRSDLVRGYRLKGSLLPATPLGSLVRSRSLSSTTLDRLAGIEVKENRFDAKAAAAYTGLVGWALLEGGCTACAFGGLGCRGAAKKVGAAAAVGVVLPLVGIMVLAVYSPAPD